MEEGPVSGLPQACDNYQASFDPQAGVLEEQVKITTHLTKDNENSDPGAMEVEVVGSEVCLTFWGPFREVRFPREDLEVIQAFVGALA